MGFFSGSTKIYVASSVYNMAGDIKKRSNYLKTNVVGGVVSNMSFGMGELIPRSYLSGPGIRMRSFSRWSKLHYEPHIGIAYGSITTVGRLDNDLIGTQIPRASDELVAVQSSEIGFGDFTQWVDQWVYETHPEKVSGSWESDYVDGICYVTFNDGTTGQFAPASYSQGQLYLYVLYNKYKPQFTEPRKTGTVVPLANGEPFPDTTGWTSDGTTGSNVDVVIHQRVETHITWSDGRPAYDDVFEASFTDSRYVGTVNWKKEEYLGILVGETTITRRTSWMYHITELGTKYYPSPVVNTTVEDIGGGITKTTTTTSYQEVQPMLHSYRIDTQDLKITPTGPLHVMIYERGTGNAVLDAMFNSNQTGQRFFPYLPIKLERWVGGELYQRSSKALKKATGGKMDKIVKELKKNKNVNDINFIYGVFGCSLNTPEDTAKEYIFRFFEMLHEAMPPDPNYPTLEAWREKWRLEYEKDKAWDAWYSMQHAPSGGWRPPAWARPEPPKPSYPTMPYRAFRINSTSGMKYDMTISWNMLESSSGSGVLWTGAAPGSLRVVDNGFEYYPILYTSSDPDTGNITKTKSSRSFEKITIQWQVSANAWKQMVVYGGAHKNRVYSGKSVDISSREALGDAEESGFIIPMHDDILRSMSLVRSTQMATANCYLVMNSYKKVKKKWYQTGIFTVVIIVIIVIVSIYSGGTAAGASGGLLGTNAAVGAAIGFAGMAAVIVGAIANALAAMILVTIIQKASTAIFGAKVGAIIGTIASLIALQVGTAMATGQSMSTMAGQMMRADNILKLTTAMGNGVAQYINAGSQELMKKTEGMMQSYNTEMKSLQKKYEDDFGYGQGVLDPRQLTDVLTDTNESRDSFLARTLMTGSDVANMSLDMITNFVDMNLQLQNS